MVPAGVASHEVAEQLVIAPNPPGSVSFGLRVASTAVVGVDDDVTAVPEGVPPVDGPGSVGGGGGGAVDPEQAGFPGGFVAGVVGVQGDSEAVYSSGAATTKPPRGAVDAGVSARRDPRSSEAGTVEYAAEDEVSLGIPKLVAHPVEMLGRDQLVEEEVGVVVAMGPDDPVTAEPDAVGVGVQGDLVRGGRREAETGHAVGDVQRSISSPPALVGGVDGQR